MTGEEFLNKVRGIKKITDIHWHVEGSDVLNPDEVKVLVVADGEEFSINYPKPGIDANVDFMQFCAIGLVVNKFMEQLNKDYKVCFSDDMSSAINHSRKQIRGGDTHDD